MRLPFGKLPHCVRLRTPFFHPDFPLIFFWSEKAGCTILAKWFFAQIGVLEEACAYGRWVHRYELEVYKAREGYRKELTAALRSGRYRAVKIVRNPWRRAVSAFLILTERGAVRRRDHWVREHWDDVDAWLKRTGRDPSLGISFVEHLEMMLDLERRRPHTINPHMSPQFVAGEEAFVGEHVPIEGFEAFCDGLAEVGTVQPVDWADLSRSGHHHVVDPAVTAALGAAPEAAKLTRGAFADGRFPAADAFVNPRSTPLIQDAYHADFQAYGTLYPER